ncbi:hypothetical protein CTI12_AA460940 [Artemisia annua]|uniref:Uncharacterized protein n=1 Tax=Artemisia annua TaxID=35608 RepID=A0A2U1LRJ1_ARTAN|nr:hypothetical protein CTI12_AA460940 [Artemisia annua]
MADFEAPSFSLGFDFDSEDDVINLVVDDSDPEYHPDPKRIRRRVTDNATSSSYYVPVVELRTDEKLHTQQSAECTSSTFQPDRLKENVSDARGAVSMSSIDIDKSLPYAHHYFFHDDRRIQELVRIRLPYFSPLDDLSNSDLEQPSTSNIDYMGQFRCGESLKQDSRNINGIKSSNSRKNSRKLKNEDTSEGWVNPKAGVHKVTTKRAVNKKGHSAHQNSGHWITGPDGKKVYVGKKGQELTGRVAYMQYKKENGLGFKKKKK